MTTVTPYSEFLRWANNAQSTLAGSISDSQTSIALASGGGARFPTLTAGFAFPGTITDVATGLLREIVLVTARTGDTLTVVRAQEGTTGLAWAANDLFAQLVTAGGLTSLIQISQLQAQETNYAVDVGTTNAYQVVLDPELTAPTQGVPVRMKAANTNNGASTLDAGDGAQDITRNDGSALVGGEIVAGGIYQFYRNGTDWQLGGAVGTTVLLTGQCYLSRTSGILLTLSPLNGNKVPVAGNLLSLPAAGTTVANTNVTVGGVAAQNLAADTVYLVAMGTTGALEYWALATGHNADTTAGNIGVEVITGHPTKTLIGMIATNGSAQFVDTSGTRTLINWFNRKPKSSRTFLSTNVNNPGAVYFEMDTAIRSTFLVWSESQVNYSATGFVGCQANDAVFNSLGFDAVTPEYECGYYRSYASGAGGQIGFTGYKTGLTEGKHYGTLLGKAVNVAPPAVVTWLGGTATGDTVVTMDVTIQG